MNKQEALNNIRTQFVAKTQAQRDALASINNNFTITSDSLKNNPPITPPITPDNTNVNGVTDTVASGIASNLDTLTRERDAKQKALENSQADIKKLMGELTGKTADTQTANETAGVNAAQAKESETVKQIASLKAQADSLNREAQAIPIQTQNQFANSGATDRGVSPITTAKLRDNALKALSLGQQADIASAKLTGSQIDLQNAKDKAQQIVDLKYNPILQEIKNKQQQYDFIKGNLSTAEKKRGEALQVSLNREANKIKKQKEDESNLNKLKIEVIKDYPQKANLLDNVKTYRDALEIATNIAQTTPKKSTLTEGQKKTQIFNSYKDVFKRGVVDSKGNTVIDSNGFVTPEAWKEIINSYPGSRADFIRKYGYLLYSKDLGAYGLTQTEQRLINGTPSSSSSSGRTV